MLETLTIDAFRPLVGSTFTVQVSAERRVEWVLVRVESLTEKRQMPRLQREPFSLVFTGPLEPFFPQQTLTLAHPDLGTLGIFIVPIGRSDRHFEYEAIFT